MAHSERMNPEPDKPCVFPFKYLGKEYNECTTEGWGNVYWCGTTSTAQAYTGWGLCKCPECGCPAPESKNKKETAKIHKGLNLCYSHLNFRYVKIKIFDNIAS